MDIVKEYPSDKLYFKQIDYNIFFKNTINNIHRKIKFLENPLKLDDKFIIYKISTSITNFLKNSSKDPYINIIFPEIKIIYNAYFKYLDKHQVFGRKWHSCLIIKKALVDQIEFLKAEFPIIENNQDVFEFSKRILEVRVLYVTILLKFLNIKKPFIAAYLLLSYKSYFLRTHGNLNLTDEKSDFEKMFNMNAYDLFNIISNQFFNSNENSYENFIIQ
ncbi:hypothetical protein DMUE_2898 [Dictyocoela muelleri]|nr:hypothetical protein DMUE_2898 [Dictyocoela muelleri]